MLPARRGPALNPAAADPHNLLIRDRLTFIRNKDSRLVAASPETIEPSGANGTPVHPDRVEGNGHAG